jgi:hypothetical protein
MTFDLLPRGVDQSILPAVLVGLFVMLFLTESFGWVFAGLIVPGYLASVFVFSPFAGLAVLVEAVLTFVVARFVSSAFSRTEAGIEFFGRERFFLLLVVAVLVRQVSEIWLLPEVARLVDGSFGTTLALDGSLSGIGLVLVPITANSFWKLDVPRGLWQVGVPTFLTYLVVAYVLLPYTNLSFSHHEVTYEDAALDFLASPKTYIVLLAGAYFASRYNLDYGWDYNGILVPGLLALTWFDPVQVLVTLTEALLLWALARGVARLPLVRGLNLEGPRRIVFVFTLGVTLRSAVAFVVGERSPEFRALDLFGFGYLLSSLLAAKMLQTKVVGRVLLPTAQVSLAGFLLGSVVGLGLDALLPALAVEAEAEPSPAPTRLVEDRVDRVAFAAAARALRSPPLGDASSLEGVAEPLASLLRGPTEAHVAALLACNSPELRVERLDDDVLVIREGAGALSSVRGRDTAIVRVGRPGPIVEVRHPLSEPETVGFALALCARLDCALVAVAAVDRASAAPPSWLLDTAQASGRTRIAVRRARQGGGDEVFADGALDPAIPVAALLPGARVWLRADEDDGRAPGIVVRGTRASLVAHAAPSDVEPDTRAGARLFCGADLMDAGAPQPTDVEFRFLAEFVMGPLLAAAQRGEGPEGAGMRLAALHAARIGFAVVYLPDGAGPSEPVAVLVPAAGSGPAWGAAAVRVGPAEPITLLAPAPFAEPGTDRLAYALFVDHRARALMIGGRPRAASSDRSDAGAPLSTDFAFHTAAHRTFVAAAEDDPLLLHVRGFGSARALPDALVIGLGAPLLEDLPRSARLRAFVRDGLGGFRPARYARSEADTLGLEGLHEPSLRFSDDLGAATAAVLWFAEPARRPFAAGGEAGALLDTPSSNLARWDGDASSFFALRLRRDRIVEALDPARAEALEAACAALSDAAVGLGPHALRRLLEDPTAHAFVGDDPIAGERFLALTLDLGGVEARVVTFGAEPADETLRLGPTSDAALERALLLRNRTIVLLIAGEPRP